MRDLVEAAGPGMPGRRTEKTIVAAGGAGFIGSSPSERLLDQYRVICVDNLLTGDIENIAPLELIRSSTSSGRTS
ncbi:MAG: hypothetical protein R3D63_04505 [Paracoccaceae bacterium]